MKFIAWGVCLLMSAPLTSQNVKQVNADVIDYSPYSDIAGKSIVSPGKADSIFNFINNELDFIEFDDCNNRDSRAHIITAIIEKKI